MAITHFKHKGLRELFETGKSSKIAPKLQTNAIRILDLLNAMHDLRDVSRIKDFHSLKGRKQTYSMHVNGNYCITFSMDGKDVINIDLEDYH